MWEGFGNEDGQCSIFVANMSIALEDVYAIHMRDQKIIYLDLNNTQGIYHLWTFREKIITSVI